jgi:hypothetical protein
MLLCLWSGASSLSALDGAGNITLAHNGVTTYKIIVPAAASASETTAASELGRLLRQMTGASATSFPVVTEGTEGSTTKVLAVGRTNRLTTAFPGTDLSALGADAILLKTSGDALFLAGEGTRGTLYAVNTFLEEYCGVRWWTPFAETIPSQPSLSVSRPDLVYKPQFSYRDTASQVFEGTYMNTKINKSTEGLAERHRFAARCRNNGDNDIPAEWGGNITLVASDKCYRDFHHFISLSEFWATHPEWFSSGWIYGSQLCLSNEAMRQEFLKRAKIWVAATPGQNEFVIMHNDNGGYCTCAACAAIDAAEESHSGSQVRFMNWLAEELEAYRPGIRLVMDAYIYSTKAPKLTRPRANLGILLCAPIRSQRLEDDSVFLGQWAGWKPIAPRILIWDYTVNFGSLLLPHPNLKHLGPNIKTMAAQGATGVFSQGNWWNTISDCEELKVWVIAHMLWDPSRDPDVLIQDFVTGYYGAAAEPVQSYLDLICSRGALSAGNTESASSWLSLADMNEATGHLNNARVLAAGDAALVERIDRIRITLDLQWLLGFRKYRKEADLTGASFLGPESALKALSDFRAANLRFRSYFNCEQYGYGTMGSYLNDMEALTVLGGKPLPPPYDQVPAADIKEFQENRFALLDGNATIVDDPLASDGKAVKNTCNHTSWNIQIQQKTLGKLYNMAGLEGNWTCLFFVRADAKKNVGTAMRAGAYTFKTGGNIHLYQTVPIQGLASNAYTMVEVGPLNLGTDALTTDVWAAPVNNPTDMDAFYIDRVVFVREKPKLLTPAAVTSGPVIGTSATLSVLAESIRPAYAAAMTYTWSTIGTPPAAVTFSPNGTGAAKTTSATFTKAGTYQFQVLIADGSGGTVTSSVAVTVSQTLTAIVVTPDSATLAPGAGQAFSAIARDQFGDELNPPPTMNWTVVGEALGTIGHDGHYSATTTAGTTMISATSQGVSGSAAITITPAEVSLTVSNGNGENGCGLGAAIGCLLFALLACVHGRADRRRR